MEVFVDHSIATGLLPALGAWFAELSDAMTRRWPNVNVPPTSLFPTFFKGLRRITGSSCLRARSAASSITAGLTPTDSPTLPLRTWSGDMWRTARR